MIQDTVYIDFLAKGYKDLAVLWKVYLPKMYGPYRVVRKWKGRTFVVWRGK